jgi:hypothetical protein
MAVYLSPGVFAREIDLSALPSAVGPLRPAFVGTAKKGPLNVPTLITTSQQAIDVFGEPFPESYLMYSVLGYLEEGNQCYVTRVGVEDDPGNDAVLDAVAVDTSGNKGKGWGRIPLFSGIDFGRLNLRSITAENPAAFHAASVADIVYNDAAVSGTNGATTAVLQTLGTYTGAINDSFLMVITSAPSGSEEAAVAGAGYAIVRNSDGSVVSEGYLVDDNGDGISNYISLGNGLSVRISVSAGELDVNDTFSFRVLPDNRDFAISVEGAVAVSYTMPTATYTTAAALVAAINTLVTGESYSATEATGSVLQLKTDVAGERLQIADGEAWALELGTSLYAYDVPRAHLLGTTASPHDITSTNNRVRLEVITGTTSKVIDVNVPVGINQTATDIASAIDVAGTIGANTYFEALQITVPGGTNHILVVASADYELSSLRIVANYTNLKTLRFADEVGIGYPYTVGYRGFTDTRTLLPATGLVDTASPLSCELSSGSDACAADTSYFEKIVGWLVAPSAGTWISGYTVTLEQFQGLGSSAGRYNILVRDGSNGLVERITDVSFDKTADRYIGNVVNPGTKYGGALGSAYLNWEPRPSFLDFDPASTAYTVRQPSLIGSRAFSGAANGIPSDPTYSNYVDAAVIGNPVEAKGLYAFQNVQNYDINLLATPGFSSGSVIAAGLQICEARGDVLYLIDSPFGLRPQEVADWHNGLLTSDQEGTINSSYGALYWSWVKIFDQFNAIEVWVPPSGHVAAIYSRTARDAEQWYAPAGLSRGRMLTALDVEYSSTQGETDLLYGSGNAVNPIVKYPNSGVVVWGQRTLQRTSSALDRVNVRMLLIYLKKSMINLLRSYIFEPNDKVLWTQVAATLTPFLADIQARRGLNAFKVVCDATNNTAERIDRNELWVSVFIQPTKAVEFVALNIAVLRTGSSFAAEEVLAAGGVVPSSTSI